MPGVHGRAPRRTGALDCSRSGRMSGTARAAVVHRAHRRTRAPSPGGLSAVIDAALVRRSVARRWLTARVDEEAGERGAVAVGVKRLCSADQLADAFEVVERRELARRVVPLAAVVA